ncbi:MAG: bifunctional phosphoribosylaminoimidazolecarboxamide formyltransferase/IMP cyclohydrolase [Pseudomonadota bacterium]
MRVIPNWVDEKRSRRQGASEEPPELPFGAMRRHRSEQRSIRGRSSSRRFGISRALISVSNKQGLKELGQGLVRHGVEIISSGGTAKALRGEGIEVLSVSDHTGFPEILDGRVKTLHPKIFGGILARATEEHENQMTQHKIDPIDLVVVNLYPFEETIARKGVSDAEAIEQIDIGGPSLVRAAAKNHERVVVVVDPSDYPELLTEMDSQSGGVSESFRRKLAGRAFAYTAAYDASVSAYFRGMGDGAEALPETITLQLQKAEALRYGENPHQLAGFYLAKRAANQEAKPPYEQLQGKDLSYNNILDVDAAWALAQDLPKTGVCIIKHTNPCGASFVQGGDVAEVFKRALATDPVSAFGGIVATNQPVTGELAKELAEMFLEAVVAPAYEEEAKEILRRKKKLRVLLWPVQQGRAEIQLRSAAGGVLVQQTDMLVEDLTEARIVTKRAPTPKELQDLNFAWLACKHVKSNAIVFAKDGQLVGVGAGQMSRVDSVKLAATKAQLPLDKTVLASDAFFPFRDGLDAAAEVGATAVVQPGGSIRDEEVIAAADERGLAMVFTGVRHFRH